MKKQSQLPSGPVVTAGAALWPLYPTGAATPAHTKFAVVADSTPLDSLATCGSAIVQDEDILSHPRLACPNRTRTAESSSQ
ncbi:hypothetical protein [Bryobacter aggregatus]|uniref:hypothetical protein n=1 Tax=Bryobacter aggregatus TaxID=360054 RepID=UPI0012BA9D81|nr:hypothetical protein [Bryobacter aggregatus]